MSDRMTRPPTPSLVGPLHCRFCLHRLYCFFGLLLLGAALFPGAGRAHGQAAPCAPNAFAIHDFQVGDVFQYRIEDPYLENQHYRVIETERKYRIVSRSQSGTRRTYRIEGMTRRTVISAGKTSDPAFETFAEDLAILDTAGSPFRGCAGDIVPMPYQLGFLSVLHTRVQVHSGDTSLFPLAGPGLRMKSYGRTELGTWDGNGAIRPIYEYHHEEIYAEGLGMVRRLFGGPFEHGITSEILVGYVKDGRTAGTLSPDSHFLPGASIKPGPAHATTRTTWVLGLLGHLHAAFDLRGRRIDAP